MLSLELRHISLDKLAASITDGVLILPGDSSLCFCYIFVENKADATKFFELEDWYAEVQSQNIPLSCEDGFSKD